ncbi:MAG: DMT family transporter [Dysgonamonadaceae bacterium]
MNQKNKIVGYILALVSATAFGLNPLFVLPIKQSSIPLDITLFYRFLMGAAMIGVFLLIKRTGLGIRLKDLPKLIIMGLLYALSSEFLFWGYDAMSAGIASTVLYTYPMMVALMLHYGYKEKITSATKLSILIALTGVAALGWDSSGAKFNIYGVFIVLMSGFVYALYMLLINKGNIDSSGIKITFYSLFFSSFYFGFKSLFLHHSFVLPTFDWVAYVAAFSLITTVISVIGIVYAIRLVGSTTTAILSAFEPLVAVCVSVLMFGEQLNWQLITGIILVLVALSVHIWGDQKELRNIPVQS